MKKLNPTTQVVRDAMKAVSKFVRPPMVVRDGIVKKKTKFTLADMQAAFKAGGSVKTWSDFGVEMEFESFEDWMGL